MKQLIKVCGKEIRVTGRLLRTGRLEGDGYDFLEDPEAMVDGLRKSGVRMDLFTFLQRLPETVPKHSYHMEWDNFAAVPVSTFDHWWTEQIGFKARNKAKQAQKKGVSLREMPFGPDLVKGICEIYNETPVRQGRRFPHYGKDLKTVYEEEATFLDRSVFIGAFLDDRLIGFVKLVSDETGTQAGLMNILSMIAHRDKAPTNALIAEAVRSCADRHISYLVYSQFAYWSKARTSIMDFKERNGFQRIDVPRYYVPFTVVGSSMLSLGLHKRFADRLPAPVLSRLREFQAAWHARKFPSAAEAS
jgi:hypothetical protein